MRRVLFQNVSYFSSAQWVIASGFIMCIGLAMAEFASAAPTSGGVCRRRCCCYKLDSTKSSCIIGLTHLPLHGVAIFWHGYLAVSPIFEFDMIYNPYRPPQIQTPYNLSQQSVTSSLHSFKQSISDIVGLASVDWACAIQITAASWYCL